jgi:hypothetical protein
MKTIKQAMGEMGFEVMDTGGGCQAWVFMQANGAYSLVTDMDNGLPEKYSAPVMYAKYDVRGDILECKNFSRLSDCLKGLKLVYRDMDIEVEVTC